MSGPDTPQNGPAVPEAPREQMTLEQAMRDYSQNYQKLLKSERERNRTREELARLAADVEKIEKVEITPEQHTNIESLQKMIALADPQMDEMRTKIVDAIFRKVESLPEQEKGEAIGRYVQGVCNEIHDLDLLLIRDVGIKGFDVRESLLKAEAEKQEPARREQLLQDAKNLAEARRRMTFPSGRDVQMQDLVVSEQFNEHWVKGVLAVPHNILEGVAHAGNWLGDTIGTTERLRNYDAKKILETVGTFTFATAGILNLAGLGVAQWNTTSNLLRNILAGEPGKAIEEIPNLFKNVMNVLPSSIATSGAAIYLATRDGSLTDLDPYITSVWNKIRSGATDLAESGKVKFEQYWNKGEQGLKNFLIENSSNFYADIKTPTKERWEAIKNWPNVQAADLERYKMHYETMAQMQSKVDETFPGQNSQRKINISVSAFNQFLSSFSEKNNGKSVDQRNLEVPIKDLIAIGFMSQNYANSISSEKTPFKVDQDLATRFLEQHQWWKTRPAPVTP